MITPSYGLTATERVLPSFTLDWTTGLIQSTVDVTRAGVATFVGSNGLIQSASTDTQRVDYSTGIAGLLVEESRTNSFTYSEDFGNASWTKSNATVTVNAIAAPDGTLTGDKLVENTATNTHNFFKTISSSSGTYTGSIFVKKAERSFFRINLSDLVAGGATVVFDLNDASFVIGASVGSWTNISANIKSFADGWYRISVTATQGAGTSVRTFFNLVDDLGNVSYTGDGTSGLFVWGAQLEAGAFATSYIPTEASAVTRNADLATVTGTNFSDFFNATEGTFLCEYQNPTTNSRQNNPIVRVDDGTNNNFISLATRNVASAATSTAIRLSGGATFQTTTGGVVTGTTNPIRMVGSYNASNIVHSANGVTPQTLAHDGVPTVNILRFNATNVGVQSNAAILLRTMAYYPFALTANEQQAFSK